jgi:hypothetical protein
MGYRIISISRTDLISAQYNARDFAEQFFPVLYERFEKAYVRYSFQNPYKVIFFASFGRFAWNGWDLFNGISKGEIKLEEKDNQLYISHKIYFLEFLIYALLFSIIPVFGPSINIDLKILLGLAIWTIYFGSCLFTIYRFNRFLTHSIASIVLLKKQADSQETGHRR